MSSRAVLISFKFAVFTLTTGNGSVTSEEDELEDASELEAGTAIPAGECLLVGAIFECPVDFDWPRVPTLCYIE
jgi:hypothetical protein